jgi:hypothetical protein
MRSVAAISTDQFDIKLERTDPVFAGGSILYVRPTRSAP